MKNIDLYIKVVEGLIVKQLTVFYFIKEKNILNV